MVPSSSSVLESITTNLCPSCRCFMMSQWMSFTYVWYFSAYCFCTGPMASKCALSPLREESQFLIALLVSWMSVPLVFKSRHFGCCPTSAGVRRLECLMWGLNPLLLRHWPCDCDAHSPCELLHWGGGFGEMTSMLLLLLSMWSLYPLWRELFSKFSGLF